MPPVLRSQASHSIALAREVFVHFGISLPAFSGWSVDQWRNAGPDCDEIRNCMLGWDVTDFGSGRFHEIGRCLFTLRNGRPADSRYPKSYAEKLIIDPEGQRAPAHYHRSKREDIVCRAGGDIIVELSATEPDGSPSGRGFAIVVDGILLTIGPRERVRLQPGESLCIPPRTIHQFWGGSRNRCTH